MATTIAVFKSNGAPERDVNTRFFAKLVEELPAYWQRLVVRPGLTGWAQVRQGYAHDLPGEIEKMRYDLYYIKHRSLWLDVRILVETALLLVFGGIENDMLRLALFGGALVAEARVSLEAAEPILRALAAWMAS